MGELIEFVEKLLDDWEANEWAVDQEFSVNQQEHDATAAGIAERRARWSELRESASG